MVESMSKAELERMASAKRSKLPTRKHAESDKRPIPSTLPRLMKETPFLSSRPIALPPREASALDYRVIEFRRAGQVRYLGDCRMDGSHEGDKSVRVFFRPPQSSVSDNLPPEQPVAPDNADMS